MKITEAEQRSAVVAEARRWIGTPYRHGSDIRKGGVDCIMLLVRVYHDLGLVEIADPRPYPPDWFLHRSEELYLAGLERYAHEVEAPEAGDIIVWRHGRTFSHGGIVTDWPRVVHAYGPARVVEESDVSLQGPLSDPKRPRRFYSLWATSQDVIPGLDDGKRGQP